MELPKLPIGTRVVLEPAIHGREGIITRHERTGPDGSIVYVVRLDEAMPHASGHTRTLICHPESVTEVDPTTGPIPVGEYCLVGLAVVMVVLMLVKFFSS